MMEEKLHETLERVWEEVTEFEEELNGVSDRAAAILAVENFATKLRYAIVRKLAQGNREFADQIDSGEKIFCRDPFHNLMTKIDIGYALGLYGYDSRQRLQTVRKIRNKFAHADKPIRFDDESISAKCRMLGDGVLPSESPRGTYMSFLKQLEKNIRNALVNL